MEEKTNKKKRLKKTLETKPVKEKAFRATKAEGIQRVNEVQTLLLEGFGRSYITQYAVEKWKLAQRQIDEYIKQATDAIKEVNEHTLQTNMGVVVSNLWKLFREARVQNNIKEQHAILMSIAKLKGLEQHTITHIIEDKRELQDMSDSDLDAILSQEQAH